ncbi:MAG: HEPN domain-containing protein [Armatimonadota bacterium]
MHPGADDWWGGAEGDLAAAETLRAGKHFNNAVFLARQAVDRALKALYPTLKRVELPPGHGLRAMARDLFGELPKEIWRVLASLDGEYTTSRHPWSTYTRPHEAYTQADAYLAVEGAREVMAWLSESLPKQS